MTKIRLMNQVRIKMKRRKLSTRFFQVDSSDNQTTCDVIDPMFQIVIVTVVLTLFLYFIFQVILEQLYRTRQHFVCSAKSDTAV